ncbi:unnamed protein product [Symbiodinium sp. CCMP2456]|nr:unnamed protein product [Symbiodinium sp. CCMP2456]
MFRAKLEELKEKLNDKNAPFGVDLLIPQVGGEARATNYDYTGGDLPELIDITIEMGAKLFVCAVGVPPKFAVDKLHAAGIPVMNMIGAPKHVSKALESGVDIICAQGGEGGGHTGDVATGILIPMVVDMCKGHKSPLTGKQVPVVAAGGIADGRHLAMSLALGADGVWVGTRFVASVEGGAPPKHKEDLCKASVHDTHRTEIYTGRPMRIIKNKYSVSWEEDRSKEMRECLQSGLIPYKKDEKLMEEKLQGKHQDVPVPVGLESGHPWLCGQVAGMITDVLPAKTIVDQSLVCGSSEDGGAGRYDAPGQRREGELACSVTPLKPQRREDAEERRKEAVGDGDGDRCEDAVALGWRWLCEGMASEAAGCFGEAIELDQHSAAAHNGRGIANEILGKSGEAQADYAQADKLTEEYGELRERLKLTRQWKPIDFEAHQARGEPEGKKVASEADFLVSFVTPSSPTNNLILNQLGQGVHFKKEFRGVSFCHDGSLGMEECLVTGLCQGRWDAAFCGVPAQSPREFPSQAWVLRYKEAATQTRQGILLLQLTSDYFLSKACGWAFAFLRKVELVHVFLFGVEGPQILRWQELVESPSLCRRAFGPAPDSELARIREVTAEARRSKSAAEPAEAEYQARCELPSRELGYALTRNQQNTAVGILAVGELMETCMRAGQAQRASELGIRLLDVLEGSCDPDNPRISLALSDLSVAIDELGDQRWRKELLERSVEIAARDYGPKHPEVVMVLRNLLNHRTPAHFVKQMGLLMESLEVVAQRCPGYGRPENASRSNINLILESLRERRIHIAAEQESNAKVLQGISFAKRLAESQ